MPTASKDSTERRPGRVPIAVLVLSNILVFQLTYFFPSNIKNSILGNFHPQTKTLQLSNHTSASSRPLDIPIGTAVPLPSIQITKQEAAKINRKDYGGEGDKQHLGGFTEIDLHGISPAVWKMIVSYFGVKSILDVGCGRGISTSWFALHGVDTLCVEGSHDAVTKSMLPDPATQVVEHDFSRGPWWPSRTVDAIWCVEFLEHVGRNFHKNYLPAFRKSALIFATHSNWGGWHHVEVHKDIWWISKFESYGFRFSQELTEMVRDQAKQERNQQILSMTGKPYNAQHVWTSMMVFINPTVAALPEHAHLFAEYGCFEPRKKQPRECGKGRGGEHESILPQSFHPLSLTDAMDKAWEDLVKRNINLEK